MDFEVIVETKKEVLDPEGRAILDSLKKAGMTQLARVEVSKRYLISIDANESELAKRQADSIAKNHLANPVSETYRLNKV